MEDFQNHCFVCGEKINPIIADKNILLNLLVCNLCQGTENEQKAIDELNEGMAEGFVCGCI